MGENNLHVDSDIILKQIGQEENYLLLQDIRGGLEEMESCIMDNNVSFCDLDSAENILKNILSLLKEFGV